MIAFLGWLSILHWGPNRAIYPFFAFDNQWDPYTYRLTLTASLVIYAAELGSSWLARIVCWLAYGVDVTNVRCPPPLVLPLPERGSSPSSRTLAARPQPVPRARASLSFSSFLLSSRSASYSTLTLRPPLAARTRRRLRLHLVSRPLRHAPVRRSSALRLVQLAAEAIELTWSFSSRRFLVKLNFR